MIVYDSCPVCTSKNILPVLSAKDFTVSGEEFEIWECRRCTLRFTQSVPGPEEIVPYYKSENYISHSDNKKGLINKIYHAVRKRTLTQKLRLVEKITGTKKGTLLDIGSGTGDFLKTMKTSGWNVTGLEPDSDARQVAKKKNGIELQPAEHLFHLSAESFDAVTMWHVLEHVHDLHGYANQIFKILKKNGIWFIAVPNYTSYDEEKYESFWAAYDVPRHLYHFSPSSMKELLTLHGFQLSFVKPMWYDSFYVSMLSEKYASGKSNLIKAIAIGLISNTHALFDPERCSSVIYIATKDG